MKIIILNSKQLVVHYEGQSFNVKTENAYDLSKKLVANANNEEELYSLIIPEYREKLEEVKIVNSKLDKVRKSKYLSLINYCYYWKDVSDLSLPDFFVTKILEAEENNDEILLESYKNFWTLLSLNTDEACRVNLFKFLHKWGIRISRSGFFVGYRNVQTTANPGIYTDHYTHTFKIKIGEMVVLDREKCDSDSSVSCSKGLMCSPLK